MDYYMSTLTGDCGNPLTVGALIASTARRGRIVFVSFGAIGTPADNALNFILQRFTAAGTSTGVTPAACDPGAPAAQLSAGENHSVEPTYTAASELLQLPLNQRNSFGWHPRQGAELLTPATAANGIGVKAQHASYVGNCDITIQHGE